jgi:hypothetical protein
MTHPHTDPAQSRAAYIEGLRMLADLLDQVPEVPIYEFGSISFALGEPEAEAFAVLDRAAEALTAAGVSFHRDDIDHHRAIEFHLAGVRYRFSRVYDAHIAAYDARQSYAPVVQIDRSAAEVD